MSLATLFLIIALILAVLAAFGASTPRIVLFPLAFAFFLAAYLTSNGGIG